MCFVVRLLCSFTLMVCFGLAQTNPESVFHAFDVSTLLRRQIDNRAPNWQLPLHRLYSTREAGQSKSGSSESESTSVGLHGDQLVEWIRGWTGPELWENEGNMLSLAGSRLIIRHEPAMIERVGEILRYLKELSLAEVRIEILVVEGDQAAMAALAQEGGVVSAARFRALGAGKDQGLSVVGQSASQTVNGRRLRVRSSRYNSFVSDYDVEVAQNAQGSDPDVRVLLSGMDVSLRPLVRNDGRISLRIQGEIVSEPMFEVFAAGGLNTGDVHLPRVSAQLFSSTTVLENGGAFFVGSVARESEIRQGLVIRLQTQLPAPLAPSVRQSTIQSRIYDLRSLLGAPLRLPRIVFGKANGDVGRYTRPDNEEDEDFFLNALGVEEIIEQIRTQVTPDFWNEPGAVISAMDGILLVRGQAEQHQGIEKFLVELSDGLQPLGLEVQVVSVPRSVLHQIRSEESEDWLRRVLKAPETTRRYSMVTAAQTASAVQMAAGREYAYLCDADLEIAQGAVISDPSVETGFIGARFELEVQKPISGARQPLYFDYEISGGSIDPLPHFPVRSADLGKLQTPETWGWINNGMVDVDPKEYRLIGEHTLPGQGGDVWLVIVRMTPLWSRAR